MYIETIISDGYCALMNIVLVVVFGWNESIRMAWLLQYDQYIHSTYKEMGWSSVQYICGQSVWWETTDFLHLQHLNIVICLLKEKILEELV